MVQFLHAQFPERSYELHHVDAGGNIIEAFATDNVDGFTAKEMTVSERLVVGEQMIIFHGGDPLFVLELDFDGNQVTAAL